MGDEQPHDMTAEWDEEAQAWRHRCQRCGAESIGNAPLLPCEGDWIEEGRRLASEREDLIAQGVDPGELMVPLGPPPPSLGWWAISGEAFLDALRRAAAGEDPEVIYAEHYANSDIERPGDEETT